MSDITNKREYDHAYKNMCKMIDIHFFGDAYKSKRQDRTIRNLQFTLGFLNAIIDKTDWVDKDERNRILSIVAKNQ